MNLLWNSLVPVSYAKKSTVSEKKANLALFTLPFSRLTFLR